MSWEKATPLQQWMDDGKWFFDRLLASMAGIRIHHFQGSWMRSGKPITSRIDPSHAGRPVAAERGRQRHCRPLRVCDYSIRSRRCDASPRLIITGWCMPTRRCAPGRASCICMHWRARRADATASLACRGASDEGARCQLVRAPVAIIADPVSRFYSSRFFSEKKKYELPPPSELSRSTELSSLNLKNIKNKHIHLEHLIPDKLPPRLNTERFCFRCHTCRIPISIFWFGVNPCGFDRRRIWFSFELNFSIFLSKIPWSKGVWKGFGALVAFSRNFQDFGVLHVYLEHRKR